MKGGSEKAENPLSKVFPELWDLLYQSPFGRLIASMPNRLKLVVSANTWLIKLSLLTL